MTAAAVGDIYQVLLQGTIENQQCENVLYFRCNVATDDVEGDLIRAIVHCFLTHLVPVMGSTYKFVRALGKRVTPDVGPDVEGGAVGAEVTIGGAEGDAEPSFVSALVSIQTERGGRSGKGRMFIPGVPEEATTASFINPGAAFWLGLVAYVACVVEAFTHVEPFAPVQHWSIGVMSRKIGGVKPPFNALGFSPATKLTPKALLATTRSRKIGHGG